MHRANDEVSSRFIEGLRMRSALDELRHDIGLVIPFPKRGRRVGRPMGEIAPATLVMQLAVESFPSLGLLFGIQQWKFSALDDWDIRAIGDFQQAQCSLSLFPRPLITAHRRN